MFLKEFLKTFILEKNQQMTEKAQYTSFMGIQLRKYVHKLLVNRLFKPAQEKVWLGELTVPQWP